MDQLSPIIIFNVSEHNLPDDGNLVPLLRLWYGRRGSAAAPVRSDLPVEDLTPWLGHLAVLEKIDAGFRFRLFGSLLTVSWQEDLTAQLLADLPEPLAILLGSVCRQCCATAQPAVIQYTAPQRFGSRPRRDLLLPVAAGDGITQLMMASYDVPDPMSSGAIPARHPLSSPLDEDVGSLAAGSPFWLILNQLPYAVYWKDRQSRYLGGNRVFAEVVGLGSYDAIPGITDYDIMAPYDAETLRRNDEQVLRTGECLMTVGQSLKLATGGTIIEKLKTPLRSETGEVIGILCVARDITEQKRVEQSLVTDKLAAEQANREKTSFLAATSYDLRQPVQALVLFTGLLSNRVVEPEARRLVSLIQQATASLANLLEAVLHLSRLDAGMIKAHKGWMPIGDLFGKLAGEFGPQAAEKGLDLSVINTDVEVHSDPLLLERILRNLISNAIRYTERGRVLIGCRRRGETMSIEVWDTGIGIPQDQIGEIFREFHRSHGETHRTIEGSGIGLAVVDRLTTLLGHHIEVSSTPSKGTVFRIGGVPWRKPSDETADSFPEV